MKTKIKKHKIQNKNETLITMINKNQKLKMKIEK